MRASEYPACIEGQNSRIDNVLRSNHHPDRFAIVECKRTDPDFSCWLFSTPKLDLRFSPEVSALCQERFSTTSECLSLPTNRVKLLEVDLPTYTADSWAEVIHKTERRVSNPQNIENAFTQVLRGVAGFAQDQHSQRSKTYIPFTTYFLPVVVTTAILYIGYYDPNDVSITDGRINKDKVHFGPKGQPPEFQKWVLVNYGATNEVAPQSIPKDFVGEDPKLMLKYKQRSI